MRVFVLNDYGVKLLAAGVLDLKHIGEQQKKAGYTPRQRQPSAALPHTDVAYPLRVLENVVRKGAFI